jgi:electron transport complex protein RnfD
MILSLMLPNLINPVFVFLGTAFAIVVVKYSFGGLGSNWLNPALGGWLFMRFSWPAAFIKALEGQEVSIAQMSTATDLGALDKSITELLNSSIFSFSEVQLPSGYVDLLFYDSPGIIADRGLFFLLIGTIAITAAGINRGWIPLVFLAVYGFLIRFAGGLTGIFWNGDILYGFFSGGTILAAFILAAEPSSNAKMKPGILLCLTLTALLSWFFRYRCMDFLGCFLAVAFINCFTPLIRLAEEKIFLSRNNCGNFRENIL